jgi:REP element-mobilizing transposase RayT
MPSRRAALFLRAPPGIHMRYVSLREDVPFPLAFDPPPLYSQQNLAEGSNHLRLLCAHIIMTVYGFWLPNDPRGSWSDFVGAWELQRFGPATKVNTRRSVAHAPHDKAARRAARRAMKYDPVYFNGIQARAVARGFTKAIEEGSYPIHACSILPDHIHLVVGVHDRSFERIVGHLKGRASQQLRLEEIHPFRDYERADGSVPSVWAEGMWKVFCFDLEHVRNAIRYVRNNPLKEDKAEQHWSFVMPFFYDGDFL